MEKNLKKEIYIYMNHFAVHLKCKSTILQLKKKSWVPSYPSLDFIVHIKASLYNILL